jgi:hypothetical protein
MMSARSPEPKPLESMVRFGGVGGFLFYPAVQLRKCRPTPNFTPRQTLMPEFDQSPFYINFDCLPVEFEGRANRHETRRVLKGTSCPKSNPLSRMSVQHLPGTMKFTKRNAFSIENR